MTLLDQYPNTCVYLVLVMYTYTYLLVRPWLA